MKPYSYPNFISKLLKSVLVLFAMVNCCYIYVACEHGYNGTMCILGTRDQKSLLISQIDPCDLNSCPYAQRISACSLVLPTTTTGVVSLILLGVVWM